MDLRHKLSDLEIPIERPCGNKFLRTLCEQDAKFQGIEIEEPLPIAGLLFAQYQYAVKELDKMYDEEIQPQMGIAIRRLLEAANKRLMELKEDLVEIDVSEYHYIDGNVVQLKLVPKDFEIIHLEGLPKKRDPQLQDNIDKLLLKGERIYEPPPPPPEEVEEEEEEEEMVEEEEKEEDLLPKRRKLQKAESEPRVVVRPVFIEAPIDPEVVAFRAAVLEVQKHERARQGRLEFFDENQLWMLRNRRKRYIKIPDDIGNKNAVIIQKWYRGYIARRDMKNREKRLRLMIGMDMPYWKPHEELDKLKDLVKLKRALREERLKQHIETIGKERERITKVIAPQLAEDIGDEIRYWFRYWYDTAAYFDKIPPPENGGTYLVIRGETLTPDEWFERQEELRREKERMKNNPALAEKQRAEKEKAKKAAIEAAKKEKERLKKEAAEAKKNKPKDEPFKFKESTGIPAILDAESQYAEDWRSGLEKEHNPKRNTFMEPVTEQWIYELQLKVREEVDVLMRLELIMLEKALCRDTRKKYKKPKNPRKGKGKKIPKGPLDHRSVEDMFQELYDNGIIRSYPETSLDDFIGEYSYCNMDLRFQPGKPLDPPPVLGDVRQLITNTCILPLAGEAVEMKPKSVCIAGPAKCGKKLLVNAICTETNAVMFDITPKVLQDKYKEKEEKKLFIIMLNLMLRALQPSVVFLDGAEKPFYKKVPKPERKEEPKKLKPILQKGIIKKITPQDRIMVIATTTQPWAGSRPFVKCYERYILIPRTDYGTIFMMWTKLLMSFSQISRDLDISALTKLTVGYPLPELRRAVEEVLTPRRITQLKYRPFHEREILEYFLQGKGMPPVSVKEQRQFFDWYNKRVPLGKQRTKVTEALEVQRLMEEIQAAKAEKQNKNKG